MRTDVVALYVDPRGPYPGLVAEWYDEARDARTYAGDRPVVAHPPCGPWGRLRHLCRRPEDREYFPHALGVVRRCGGVVEHPAYSTAWQAYALPRPGEVPDAFGGWTLEVCQCDFGHVARKRMWLYVCGTRWTPVLPPPREPTHWVTGGRGRTGTRNHTPVPAGIKIASAQQRHRTPRAFAEWLIEVAASAGR